MIYELRDEQKEKEAVLVFYLTEDDGVITLCARDKNDFDWSLLQIEDGQISTIRGVSGELGFEVEKNGEVKVYHE